EQLEARFRAVRHRDGDSSIQLDDRRGDEIGEASVEERDLLPVGLRLEVERRDRCLELVRAGQAEYERAVEGVAALLGLVHVPEVAILVLEQHELARGRDARVAARVLQEEEGMEAVRLRLVGHERREDGSETDRFDAQLLPRRW